MFTPSGSLISLCHSRDLHVDIFGRWGWRHYSILHPQGQLMVLHTYYSFYCRVIFPGSRKEEVGKDEKTHLPAKLDPTQHLCQPLLGQYLLIWPYLPLRENEKCGLFFPSGKVLH